MIRLLTICLATLPLMAAAEDKPNYLWATAYAVPKETTSEGSGYFSIVEGMNGKLYIGSAKYGANAYLVEFDPATKAMKVVVDCQKEIGTTATGFAAQAKIHTRNNVGPSGKIYFGTKQGYPKDGESRDLYAGGYPMVYDPATGKTKVYPIPVPKQGVISVTPDEARNVAYISTCDDARPIESTHFMALDLEKGTYRDLLDCRHMYAFVVVDHRGRAYHPILGGDIARFDPAADRLERLTQTIDGAKPGDDSLFADPKSHPVNWEVSPDRKTLWSVAMSGNSLVRYDLAADGGALLGKTVAPLVAGAKATDCRALCVAPDGVVWAGIALTKEGQEQRLHVVSHTPDADHCVDHGPLAIRNPEYTTFKDEGGKDLPWHHGVTKAADGTLLPRYVVMGICTTKRAVYVTTLYPFTLLEIPLPR